MNAQSFAVLLLAVHIIGGSIARHLTNMMAGTIATVTAVLVVNVATDPVWIAWIAPTVVITPFIFYWNKRTLSTSQ